MVWANIENLPTGALASHRPQDGHGNGSWQELIQGFGTQVSEVGIEFPGEIQSNGIVQSQGLQKLVDGSHSRRVRHCCQFGF